MDIAYGMYESAVHCNACKCAHFSFTYNPFNMLTLEIPDKAAPTLDECLQLHFKAENVGAPKGGCDGCGSHEVSWPSARSGVACELSFATMSKL